VLLLSLTAGLLLPVTAAIAAAPLHQSVDVDETFPSRLTELCGVPVYTHLEGTLSVTYFYDASGTQIVREIDFAPGFKFTVFSPLEAGGTGQSLTSPSPAVLHIYYPAGTTVGSPAMVTVTGLTGFAAPGFAGAGRQVLEGVVFDTSEDGLPLIDWPVSVISVVGSYNRDVDPLAARCDFLAGR
jgi:hypothetical protein